MMINKFAAGEVRMVAKKVFSFLMILFMLPFLVSVKKGEPQQSIKENTTLIHLFELKRLNYKPYKSLYYDVIVQDSNCHLKTENPLDVYYVTNDVHKARLEMSKRSQEYFIPDKIERPDEKTLLFSFKALKEFSGASTSDSKESKFQSPILPRIEVLSRKSKDENKCEAQAYFNHQGKDYPVKQIQVEFNLFLGFPIGLDYVRLYYVNSAKETKDNGKKEPKSIAALCLYGVCPTP